MTPILAIVHAQNVTCEHYSKARDTVCTNFYYGVNILKLAALLQVALAICSRFESVSGGH